MNSKFFILSLWSLLTFSIPAFGEEEGWRTYWGAGTGGVIKSNYHNPFSPIISAHTGLYRPYGEKGWVGISSSFALYNWWPIMDDIKISAIRYPGEKIGRGRFYKAEVGFTHRYAPTNREGYRWEEKVWGFEFLPWAGGGYDWKWKENKLIRLQGQISIRYGLTKKNILFQWFLHIGQWR